MRFLLAIVCLILPFSLPAKIKHMDVDGIEFAYRVYKYTNTVRCSLDLGFQRL